MQIDVHSEQEKASDSWRVNVSSINISRYIVPLKKGGIKGDVHQVVVTIDEHPSKSLRQPAEDF